MLSSNFACGLSEREVTYTSNLKVVRVLYHGSQFYRWRKPEYPEKTTELSKLTMNRKLCHL